MAYLSYFLLSSRSFLTIFSLCSCHSCSPSTTGQVGGVYDVILPLMSLLPIMFLISLMLAAAIMSPLSAISVTSVMTSWVPSRFHLCIFAVFPPDLSNISDVISTWDHQFFEFDGENDNNLIELSVITYHI